MIDLRFEDGTRTTSDVPLIDVEQGVRLVGEDGNPITLTVRWPDDPVIARPRGVFLATLEEVEHATMRDSKKKDADGTVLRERRTDLPPVEVADLTARREDALRAYAAALVAGWSFPTPCTPAAVLALFARAPFAYQLVVDAAGDADRFLPASLRGSGVASEPPPTATA